MRLVKLEIENFRQFKERQIIDFPFEGERNVVVIHGKNGSGKTSILNAFKWAFYGEVDFDSGDSSILNQHSADELLDGGEVSVEVCLEFVDSDKRYELKREWRYVKKSGSVVAVGDSVLDLRIIGVTGESERPKNPSSEINLVLPKNLQPYFFFNGERIEKLSYSSRADEVKAAIKNLMGLTIVDRAIKHLGGGVARELKRDVSDFSSQELRDVQSALSSLYNELSDQKSKKSDVDKNIKETEKSLQDIRNILRDIERVADLQLDLDRISEEMDKQSVKNKELHERQRSLVSSQGFLNLSKELFENVSEKLDDAKARGVLPAPVRAQLVKDIIKNQVCICGTPISEGSKEFDAIKLLQTTSSDEKIESVFFQLQSDAGRIDDELSSFHSSLIQIRKDIQENEEDFKKNKESFDEISQKINQSDVEEARKAQAEKEELSKIYEHNVELRGKIKLEIDRLDIKIAEEEKKKERLLKVEGSHALSEVRRDAASNIESALNKLLEHLTNDVRDTLSAKVDKVFSSIIRKRYKAKISDDFTLEVFKPLPNGGEAQVTEKSTGESQVCSLSFIASIVADAKERQKKESRLFYRGGVFPLVMDSPFGALDPEYRRLVARYVPELADQVVILVSESQWNGEVSDECSKRISAAYSLKPKSDNELDISVIEKEI